MAEELLYTSAPEGLHPGRRGYCTVLQSRGLPKKVQRVLESASSYRWAIPPSEQADNQTPVNYAHTIFRLGLLKQHVLSRIAAYGFDYSHRTNHIAHHIVLNSDELPAVGPASLLNSPSFLRTQWNEETKYVASVEVPQGNPLTPRPCTEWARLTGDAGWAGVVAQNFLSNDDRSIYVIFPKNRSLLPLMEEVAMLLPEEKRWDFTFSTYFTDLPGVFECRCRCVLAESPECQRARQLSNTLVVDLLSPGPVPVSGPLVDEARTGKRAARETSKIVKTPARAPALRPTGAVPVRRPVNAAIRSHSPDAAPAQAVPQQRTKRPGRSKSRIRKRFVIAGIATVFLFAILVVVFVRNFVDVKPDKPAPDTGRNTVLTTEAENSSAMMKKFQSLLKESREAERHGKWEDADTLCRRAKIRADKLQEKGLMTSKELEGIEEGMKEIRQRLQRLQNPIAKIKFGNLKQEYDKVFGIPKAAPTQDDIDKLNQTLRLFVEYQHQKHLDDRSRKEFEKINEKIVSQWIKQLVAAIRKHDKRYPIYVQKWAEIFSQTIQEFWQARIKSKTRPNQ